MRRQTTLLILPVLLTAVAVQLLAGCEESVDPVLGTNNRYTVYGFLNPAADTQAVRVFEIEDRLRPTPAEPLDAEVWSTSIASSEQTDWKDSVVTYLDGSVGHVFHAAFQPQYDSRHRFVIEAPDGTRTETTIQMAPRTQPNLYDILSAPANVLVKVLWEQAPRILETEVVYHLRSRILGDARIFDKTVRIDSGRIQKASNGDLIVIVEPSKDIGSLYDLLSLRPGVDDLALVSIDVRAFVASADWDPPGGGFDPELLVQPGTFSNITNGFGFLGSGYYDTFNYTPTDEIRQNAGFDILND
jgi:hypothetical protein